jgi:hypothetical protein
VPYQLLSCQFLIFLTGTKFAGHSILAHFDTSSLDWVRIDLGRGRIPGAYGRCWYPTRKPKKGYRISIQVPGPFPYNHLRYIKPLYQNVPPWAKPTGYCEATRNGVVRRWRRLTTEYRMETRETGLVHVLAHEVFHFLHRSRQIPGRNGENEADQFAVAIEDEFRRNSTCY